MKRKALLLFMAMNVLIVGALGGMLILSEAYPLRPGTGLYKLQHVAEQWRMQLIGGDVSRATMALELAERRLGDLAMAGEEGLRNAAAVAFDRALEEAVRQVEASPAGAQGELREELDALLGRAEMVLDGQAGSGDVVLATLQREVEVLVQGYEPVEEVASVPEPVELKEAEPIPFLGQEIDHTKWPLAGGHEGLDCEQCHEAGVYAGTADGCAECHEIPESELYADHFEGECEDCHLVDSWEPEGFDHAGIVECQSCHDEKRAGEHYAWSEDQLWLVLAQPGRTAASGESALLGEGNHDRCADCHTSTESWEEYKFEHLGFTECEECHERVGELRGHYEGQCSWCHTTEDWEPLSFEHANIGECLGCHGGDSPAEHYILAGSYVWYTTWESERSEAKEGSLFTVQQTPASCGNCHLNTEEWSEVEFDHTGFEDCESCHAREGELEGHYAGSCENCHVVESWEEVNFDHTGYSDCQGCHRPEEVHYPAQCSQCHSEEEWGRVEFSHEGFASCRSCHEWERPEVHYERPCAECHTTEAWGEIIFEHRDAGDCESCHGIGTEHYRGPCSLCHNTEKWAEAIQPHSGLIGCGSCHTVSSPHYKGGCLNCHNTTDWEKVDFDHTRYDDCRACHEEPAQHYPAQCSVCHNTEQWSNYYVNHAALAGCGSCHAAPGGHWGGECSLCHSSQTWDEMIYVHYVGSDCVACHQTPAGHWTEECTLCHNLTNWSEVSVNHAVLTDCQSCHIAPEGHWLGQCSLCHNTSSWNYTANHDLFYDCQSCHIPPEGHWPGQCSSCHGTSSWDEYTFNHDGYDNCKACHSQDRPASHPRGQCSQCHNTDSWSVPEPTPTPTEEPPTPTPTLEPPTPTPTPTPTQEPPTPTPIPPTEPVPTGEATSTPDSDSIAP